MRERLVQGWRALPGRARYALTVLVVAGAYVAAGKLGLDLAFATTSVTAIWPPTGIALAAIVLGGYRLWPAVAIGALLTNVDTGVPALTVLGITAGNTLEALAGGWLLNRVGFRPSFERVGDLLALVGLAGVLSTIVAATIGVGSLIGGDAVELEDAPTVWRTWWLGDMGGDLLVAPALLIAAAYRPRRRPPGHALEGAALAAALAVVTVLAFSNSSGLTYLVFPLLIWAALRFWQPGAAVGSLLVAAIAVVLTDRGEGPYAMSSPDERLLLAQTFAGVAATSALVLAIVTSQRRRAEEAVRKTAMALQESLLPPGLPQLPGVELASYFRAAGPEQDVGGDFYDLFQLDGDAWAVVLGDVRGKGPRAASITALARYTLRATAVYEPGTSRVLERLNEVMLQEHHGEEFCSVAFARVRPGKPTVAVTVCSAGHPLPLLLRSDGRVEEFGQAGSLLGVSTSPQLHEAAAELHPGDTALFYTDGLIDAFAPRRVLDPADLAALLSSCGGSPASEVVRHLESTFLSRGGGEPRDDVAIVALHATAPERSRGPRRPGRRARPGPRPAR
jgi:integral membrane sensor domain MASE1/serine phosphatase RsbU (regulator of sigma subunit)